MLKAFYKIKVMLCYINLVSYQCFSIIKKISNIYVILKNMSWPMFLFLFNKAKAFPFLALDMCLHVY